MKNRIKYSLYLLLGLIINISCNSVDPKPNKILLLQEEDKSCTEIWLKLSLDGIEANESINIYQNESLIQTINTEKRDTVLYYEGLSPNQNYKYQANILSGINQPNLSSEIVTVRTMDTTSHNFSWETFTFGGSGGSSYLKDVAIINENDIWAVGDIRIADTSRNGYTTYNAVHWDGNSWELKRIDGNGYRRSVVYAFDENDVWFDGVIKWDGSKYSVHTKNFPLEPNGDGWYKNSMWGTSSKDFYIVGNNGNIAHYNGNSWEKIESGTDADLVDIWGSTDGRNIWICGNENFKPTVLLKIKNNKADILYNSRDNLFSYNFNRLSGDFTSVWTNRSNILYILTAYDLYKIYKDNISNPIPLWKSTEQIATRKARGTESNNIFTVGENGELSHYNGISWKTYDTLFKRFKEYKSISVKKNAIVAVGKDYINGIEDKAIITITKK